MEAHVAVDMSDCLKRHASSCTVWSSLHAHGCAWSRMTGPFALNALSGPATNLRRAERAAVSAWKERGVKATPPSSAELQAAAGMLGEVVDATGTVSLCTASCCAGLVRSLHGRQAFPSMLH